MCGCLYSLSRPQYPKGTNNVLRTNDVLKISVIRSIEHRENVCVERKQLYLGTQMRTKCAHRRDEVDNERNEYHLGITVLMYRTCFRPK